MRTTLKDTAPKLAIPDLKIGQVYFAGETEKGIYHETFERLADFFGRNTSVHRHNRYYQIHLLLSGSIRLSLDDEIYSADAPVLVFTPPNVPHSFYTEDGSNGHVLTVEQEIVQSWQRSMAGQWSDNLLRQAVFIDFNTQAAEMYAELTPMLQLAKQLQTEFRDNRSGRTTLLNTLSFAFFIHMGRVLQGNQKASKVPRERGEDLRLFLKFYDLIEGNYRSHITLPKYAAQLCITEARLNDICQRMGGQSAKEIVHDRLLHEARWLLRFTTAPIGEIALDLGFSDSAYFSRFFTKKMNVTPSQYRLN